MELFFTKNISGSVAVLEQDEYRHCIKVLRHKTGDVINFIDGKGGLYKGTITAASGNTCTVEITETIKDYPPRSYSLHMAVSPTKNLDRYEWFLEKAVELGLDELTPIIGDHSERRVFKPERAERIFLSAVKQSLKANLPILNPMISAKEFITGTDSFEGVKIIAHCNEGDRKNIIDILTESNRTPGKAFLILIGPEGDFSPEEVKLAIAHGFIPATLGESRLRTETAALAAVTAVYFNF